jgi:hypothetical protein
MMPTRPGRHAINTGAITVIVGGIIITISSGADVGAAGGTREETRISASKLKSPQA